MEATHLDRVKVDTLADLIACAKPGTDCGIRVEPASAELVRTSRSGERINYEVCVLSREDPVATDLGQVLREVGGEIARIAFECAALDPIREVTVHVSGYRSDRTGAKEYCDGKFVGMAPGITAEIRFGITMLTPSGLACIRRKFLEDREASWPTDGSGSPAMVAARVV